MDEITITLTRAHANDLAKLIDVAVRAGGIETARPALFFIDLMERAAADAKAKPKDEGQLP